MASERIGFQSGGKMNVFDQTQPIGGTAVLFGIYSLHWLIEKLASVSSSEYSRSEGQTMKHNLVTFLAEATTSSARSPLSAINTHKYWSRSFLTHSSFAVAPSRATRSQ